MQLYLVKPDLTYYEQYNEMMKEWNESKTQIAPWFLDKPFETIEEFAKFIKMLEYSRIQEIGANEFFISCNKYNINGQKFYEKMGGKIIHIDEDNIDKSIPQVKFHYDVV